MSLVFVTNCLTKINLQLVGTLFPVSVSCISSVYEMMHMNSELYSVQCYPNIHSDTQTNVSDSFRQTAEALPQHSTMEAPNVST